MITCTNYKQLYVTEKEVENESGEMIKVPDKWVVWVELFTATTPDPLPTTIKDMVGFPKSYEDKDVQFAGGSTLYIVNTTEVYIADETGKFVLQK